MWHIFIVKHYHDVMVVDFVYFVSCTVFFVFNSKNAWVMFFKI